MISKVLIFKSQHEAADALKKLETNGFEMRVIVSELDHSRLLNAETAIHIDLLSEITVANREGRNDNDPSVAVPFFIPQVSNQFQLGALPLMTSSFNGVEHDQELEALHAYGLNNETARSCLNELKSGHCVVCLLNNYKEGSLLDSLYAGESDDEHWLPETGAAIVLNNR